MLPKKNCVEELFYGFPLNAFPQNDFPLNLFPQNSVEVQRTMMRTNQLIPRLLIVFVGNIGEQIST